MSRTGTRDTNTVPRDKLPAFVKLMDALADRHGSRIKALRAAGVNSGQWYAIAAGRQNLTVTLAKKILTTYKACK